MIHLGDCIEVMRGMEPESVDAVVTDPPYGLEFMGKRWDVFKSPGRGARVAKERAAELTTPGKGHTTSKGPFLAAGVDQYIAGTPFQAWCREWGAEALRVTKPGGYLLAFGGTRTHHRLVCGLEDAGWEIRDELQHIYASGFPKSHNVSNSERFCHCGREAVSQHDVRSVQDADVPPPVATTDGSRPVLFSEVPEPDVSAAANGTVEDPDGSHEPSVEGRGDAQEGEGELRRSAIRSSAGVGATDGPEGRVHHGAPASDGNVDGSSAATHGGRESSRPQSGEQRPVEPRTVAVERDAQGRGVWPLCDRCGKPMVPAGLGTALKPAHEPIILARKPLSGTVAANVTRYGTGALNIDGTRIGTTNDDEGRPNRFVGINAKRVAMNAAEDGSLADGVAMDPSKGRWPSNVLLDSEHPELFDEPNPYVVGSGATVTSGKMLPTEVRNRRTVFGQDAGDGYTTIETYGDSGGYSRFFIVPKADRTDREPVLRTDRELPFDDFNRNVGNTVAERRLNSHPTVKPTDLMRHLVRLVTPPGGVVLDPFLGSGTTAIACELEGFEWVGIEKEPEYVEIAKARLNGVQRGLGLIA